MALYLIATPIGNPKDISLRALETLKAVQIVIGEELKITRRLLADNNTGRKDLYKLNEHSTEDDINYLVKICTKSDVALVSDCGTPGFCDPGSRLIKELRKNQVTIHSLPGASSLMYLLSLSSRRLDSFYFAGFLPANTTQRAKAWNKIKNYNDATFLLETPYRFNKLAAELCEKIPESNILIGINLSQEDEIIWEGRAKNIPSKELPKKAEPIVLIYPK